VVAIGYEFRLGVKAAAEHLHAEIEPRLAALWPKGDQGSRIVVCGLLPEAAWWPATGSTKLAARRCAAG
jgi:hypothetical protein